MRDKRHATSGPHAAGQQPQPFYNRRTRRLQRWLTRILFAGMIDMDFNAVRRYINILIIIAFEVVILFLWWSAILDIPHHFYGVPPRPFHWAQPTMQTIWLLLLLLFVLAVLRAFFKQLRYLEGFLPVCSFCKSIRAGEEWVPLERYMQEHSALKMTHSLCPLCAKQYYDYDEAAEAAASAVQGQGDEHGG